MEGQEPEVICRFCGVCSRSDRVFCLGCGRRLATPSDSVLRTEDFASDADRSSLEALRGTEPLPHIVEKLVPSGRERSEAWLSRYALRVRPTSRLDTLVRGCGEILGLEMLPAVYIAPSGEANAFTTGSDEHPLLVICSPALEVLNYTGLEGLVSHELAHVRSRHVLYHSLAESLASGVQVAASMLATGLVTIPIRMALLSWYRESEVSADRASLLMLGNYGMFESLMAGLASADASGEADAVGDGSLTELLQTHPSIAGRLRLAREFMAGPEYFHGRSRIMMATTSSRLMAICAQCGFVSPRAEVFCPNCGVSRA